VAGQPSNDDSARNRRVRVHYAQEVRDRPDIPTTS
jgi:hypothetical protein